MPLTLPEQTHHFHREQHLPHGMERHEAIRTMAHEVAALLGLPHAGECICRTALQREEEECTLVGCGLAVPHARVKDLPHAAVYTAHCPSGLPWPESASSAEVVALLVVPEDRPELHLSLLSSLVRARLKGTL